MCIRDRNKVVKAHKRIKKMVKVSLDNVKLLVDVDKEPFFKPSSTTVGDLSLIHI